MKPSKTDPSMNKALNGVTLPTGDVVTWAEAFDPLSLEAMRVVRERREAEQE